MSIKLFTEDEIAYLNLNPYVKKVSDKGITYTDEFKRIFMREYENGKYPTEIFESYGFDKAVLGSRRIKSSAERWRNAYQKDGVCGLVDSRKGGSGRPNLSDLSLEEKNERLMVQINLLKAENELLKKMEQLERQLRRKK